MCGLYWTLLRNLWPVALEVEELHAIPFIRKGTQNQLVEVWQEPACSKAVRCLRIIGDVLVIYFGFLHMPAQPIQNGSMCVFW